MRERRRRCLWDGETELLLTVRLSALPLSPPPSCPCVWYPSPHLSFPLFLSSLPLCCTADWRAASPHCDILSGFKKRNLMSARRRIHESLWFHSGEHGLWTCCPRLICFALPPLTPTLLISSPFSCVLLLVSPPHHVLPSLTRDSSSSLSTETVKCCSL